MTLSKKNIRHILLFSLLFMFCGHAFCYMNLSFSGASVMVDASSGNQALTANGQFLATLYWRVRGALSSPMTVGLVSTVCLTGAAILIADLLGLTHALTLFSLCGVLALHIGVTAINAAMLHMADLYFLALLFAAAGAWLCIRHPLGFIPAALCVFACLGMQASLLAACPVLVLTACMLRVLRGSPVRDQLIALGKMILSVAAGFSLYLAGALFFAARRGAALSAAWQLPSGEGLLDTWLYPIRQLCAPTTAYAALCAFLLGLLFALSLLSLIVHLRGIRPSACAFAILSALLLPLVIHMPVFAEAPALAVCEQYVLCLLPIAMLALLDLLCGAIPLRSALLMRRGVTVAFGVTFLSSVVFANQVYLKKNLEYQSTLSVMTRVIEQAEQTDGYAPGFTPVAIVGTIEDSILSVPHKGFEHLGVLDAASNNFTASSQAQNTWYFWEIMGYPFNLVGDADRDALAATETVAAMPAFPQSGCCAMVEGTLVIKLSD